tara:strand:- start:236 stop:565 length:330 start_codon:yes stop_codon:yes gene_type:complete
MNNKNNKESVIFYCDFRSPPSGLGTFGDDILVQDTGSCPAVKEGIYSEIIKLEYSGTETKSGFLDFINVLVERGVTHVYDTELETNLSMRYKDKCYPIEIYKKEVVSWF